MKITNAMLSALDALAFGERVNPRVFRALVDSGLATRDGRITDTGQRALDTRDALDVLDLARSE